MQNVENHMVIPQTDLMPRLKSPSVCDVLDSVFATSIGPTHQIEDMDWIVDDFINQESFTDVLRSLLNPETSEAQLKNLRSYVHGLELRKNVIAELGDGEHMEALEENVLEAAK